MKIYYDNENYVCNRYPLDKKIIDKNKFIEVDDEEGNKTQATAPHFAWFVENGQLVNKRYEEMPIKELIKNKIYDLKQELKKIKEDVEQVELFGMTRTDYEEKKARCREIITELRTLESQI